MYMTTSVFAFGDIVDGGSILRSVSSRSSTEDLVQRWYVHGLIVGKSLLEMWGWRRRYPSEVPEKVGAASDVHVEAHAIMLDAALAKRRTTSSKRSRLHHATASQDGLRRFIIVAQDIHCHHFDS
jgi:hypothetical protein